MALEKKSGRQALIQPSPPAAASQMERLAEMDADTRNSGMASVFRAGILMELDEQRVR